MSNRLTLTLTPDSAFLLGGLKNNPAYNAVTAVEKKTGLPFIPATAIKGALRMEFETFFRGVERAGWDGFRDSRIKGFCCDLGDRELEEDGAIENRGCGQCLACILFGGGNEEGKMRFNAGVLTGGCKNSLQDIIHEITPKGRREGVTISRTLGKAREGNYFSTLTFPDLKGIIDIAFDASIDLYGGVEEERRFLEVFLGFLERTGLLIGSGKSTGLGHFKVKWKLPATHETKRLSTPKPGSSGKELKLLAVTLKTEEPLIVGSIKNLYVIDTMSYIPSSTMGGSIGFGLLRQGVPDETVAELFNPETQKSLITPFNFYKDTPFPYPASTMKPKGAGDRNGDNDNIDTGCPETDILLKDFIIKRAIKKNAFARNDIQKLYKEIYLGKLRPVEVCRPPDKTYITRVGLDRQLQRAGDGLLYSMETIDVGTTFKGLLICDLWTKETLEKKHLLIGAKRTRGHGKTLVQSIQELNPSTLLNFTADSNPADDTIKHSLKSSSLSLPTDTNRAFYTLDLLSDLFIRLLASGGPPGGLSEGQGGAPLGTPKSLRESALVFDYLKDSCFAGLDVVVEKAYVRSFWQGGYDFRNKVQKPMRLFVGAGSTFLVSVPITQDPAFKELMMNMIRNSVNFDWDNTPLFLVNNPVHFTYGGNV